MAMTADEILSEITREFQPATAPQDVAGAPVSQQVTDAQRKHADGIRPAHLQAALADSSISVESWSIGEGSVQTYALAPLAPSRPARLLIGLASTPAMEMTVTTAWKLRGAWADPASPTELFAEFVARYGFALSVAGNPPQLFTARATVLPGQEAVHTDDLPPDVTISAVGRGDPQTGNQHLAWVYGIRDREYRRELNR